MTMQMNNQSLRKCPPSKPLMELANELEKELRVFEKRRQELLISLGLLPCYPFSMKGAKGER